MALGLLALGGCRGGGDDTALGEADIFSYGVSPEGAHLDFPDTFVGDVSPPRSITLTNDGRLSIDLRVGEISRSDFAFVGQVPSNSLTLEPGEALTLQITFEPVAMGIAQGILTLEFDEPTLLSPLDIALEGEGVDVDSFTPELTNTPFDSTPSEEPTTAESTPTYSPAPSDTPSPIDTPSPSPSISEEPYTPFPETPTLGPTPTEGLPMDADGDGYYSDEDCDDGNGSISPSSPETCDGVDEDCDGRVDEAFDEDGDGYPTCPGPGRDVDCDDQDDAVNPGEVEDWSDSIDQNCDGRVTPDAIVSPDSPVSKIDTAPAGAPQFRDIGAAIDASEDGWLILIYPGTYPGALVLPEGQSLTLLGAGAAEDVIVSPALPDQRKRRGGRSDDLKSEDDGDSDEPLLRIEGGSHHVEAMTFSGAAGVSVKAQGGQGTLRHLRILGGRDTGVVLDRSDVFIDDVHIEGCFGEEGGALRVEGGAPVLRKLSARDNRGLQGGGLYVKDSDLKVVHSRFEGNSAEVGGGLYAKGGRLEVDNSVFSDNQVNERGGGLALIGVGGQLTHVVIRGNRGAQTQGILGGGIYASGESPSIFNGIFSGNKAEEGGGIYGDGAALVAQNVALSSNSATLQGGGVMAEGGALTLGNAIIAFNAAPLGYNLTLEGARLSLESSCLYGQWEGEPVVGATIPMDEDVWFGDPGYLNDGGDGVWLDDDYHLSAQSQALDRGLPDVLDPDGSPSDLGPFGGPGAASFDLDGDGAPEWWNPLEGPSSVRHDCDDEDVNSWPGQGCP